jgi:prevent-host-death family protein
MGFAVQIVNIHDAKTHLSRLVEQAAHGESFVIAKAGKPLAKVTAIDAPMQRQRLGFLAGEIAVPADFDCMGAEAIEQMFGGDS